MKSTVLQSPSIFSEDLKDDENYGGNTYYGVPERSTSAGIPPSASIKLQAWL